MSPDLPSLPPTLPSSSSPAEVKISVETAGTRHTMSEDMLAVVSATLMVGLGIALCQSAGLITGGIFGISSLINYGTGLSFGALFFWLNLPFYWLAVRQMGIAFTVKTLATVTLLSYLLEAMPAFFVIKSVHPAFAATAGAVALGLGVLALLRHNASLGGTGVLAAYLQEKHGWSAGYFHMALDVTVLAAALLTGVEPAKVAWSILAGVVVNLVIAFNHKPGRYTGF